MSSKRHYQQARKELVDRSVPANGRDKQARTMMGLDTLYSIALPGVCYDDAEIAAFAGCSPQAVQLTAKRALRKLAGNPTARRLLEELVRNQPQRVLDGPRPNTPARS